MLQGGHVNTTAAKYIAGLAAAFVLTAVFGWALFTLTPAGTVRFDSAIRQAIHASAHPAVTPLMITASSAGKPMVLWAIAVVTSVLFWCSGSRHAAQTILITMA